MSDVPNLNRRERGLFEAMGLIDEEGNAIPAVPGKEYKETDFVPPGALFLPSDFEEAKEIAPEMRGGYHVRNDRVYSTDIAGSNMPISILRKKVEEEVAKADLLRSVMSGETVQQWEAREAREKQLMPPRIGEQTKAGTVENPPKCKVHNKFMKYDPAEDAMLCVETGCKVRARKRRTFKDSLGAKLAADPTVYRGSLYFTTDEEGMLYLFLPEANAMIDLSGLANAEPFQNDPAASGKAMHFLQLVGSHIPAAQQAALNAKRMKKKLEETERVMERRGRTFDPTKLYDKRAPAPLRVHGNAMVMGMKLPPHLDSDEKAHAVLAEHQRLMSNGVLDGMTPQERMDAVLESLFPNYDPVSDTVHVPLFNRAGQRLDTLKYDFDRNYPLRFLKSLAATIEELEGDEDIKADELPLYALVNGKPLTYHGVRREYTETLPKKQYKIH